MSRENKMDYHALVDDCEHCRYLVHAFNLLGLPLSLHQQTFSKIPSAIQNHASPILFYCAKLSSKITIETQSQFVCLVSVNKNPPTRSNRTEESPLLSLNAPFTLYQFKQLLSDIQNHLIEPSTNILKNPLTELVGISECIQNIKSLIKKVAGCESTVLIEGESGTGKEIIANCIHQLSTRNKMPFIPINCGAIPSELVESELFGHEKGAFTGAATRRVGRFELAQLGTLFLDEIGDMPLSMQVKLLRVIQERKFERIGGHTAIYTDVRIITATNKNLKFLSEKSLFREDLFYRLNVFPIRVAPLRERREDIPLLIDFHLGKIAKRIPHASIFSPEAIDLLTQYSWPGNVRELENFLERVIILHRDHLITAEIIKAIYPNLSEIEMLTSG